MMMDKLFNFLPPSLREDAVIAGGYAVDPDLATDIDLWVCAGPDVPQARWAIEEWLKRTPQWPNLKFSPAPEGAQYGTAHLVATIPNGYAGKAVQLLVSEALDSQQLVDSFDISTHALARRDENGTARLWFGTGWTYRTEPPKVLRWDTPADTAQRLVKLSQRYGAEPKQEDLQKLFALVEDEIFRPAA